MLNTVSNPAHAEHCFQVGLLKRYIWMQYMRIIAAKAVTTKLGLWVRKLEGTILDMFSGSKDFMAKNGVEASDTGIDQRIINVHLVNLQSGCSK
jgi:hypothetical protein